MHLLRGSCSSQLTMAMHFRFVEDGIQRKIVMTMMEFQFETACDILFVENVWVYEAKVGERRGCERFGGMWL